MNQELLHKFIEAIVAEVVRRVAILERQKQHPEDVLVLIAAPTAYPEELKALLRAQFGEGYTPLCFRENCELPHAVYAEALSQGQILEQVTKAKTVILIAPRLEQLQEIAEGNDRDFLSYLMIRSVLWRKDVRLYLDFEPPRFKRNTFLEGVSSSLDTLREMGVTVSPYYTGDAARQIGESLVTEADVLAAADRADKTIRCRVGAIITPAARDALAVHDVIVQYEGEKL
jgi:hypothetical protein